jgi:hypothetical protein
MDPKEEVTRLREQAVALEETIEDIDYQIERAMHAVTTGTDDVGRAIPAQQTAIGAALLHQCSETMSGILMTGKRS